MLIKDLLKNDFDVNCNYTIYDCTEKDKNWHESPILFSTVNDGYIPPESILNMNVKYVTLDIVQNTPLLIIEAENKN